ncbi:ATPase P [Desulfopila sp. IMCC35006]|uniref:HAD family hydrolase n=1 Tax=Desulfopila sp. IMCC35006 TaxID=2569542 RepID=UPI0010AC1BA2|nr:HAD family hydrolase [Desulfopila sp. IMCC35006]TKB25626.1 ATPase P [Desulfopila sp. IMCC35006]
MITVQIPGGENLQLSHLVLDYNGTLALDGDLIAGVAEKIRELAIHLQLHVITADTHGTVAEKLKGLPCTLHIIGPDTQDRQKQAYVQSLGAEKVAAIGNGRNDGLMLQTAALGIVLVQREGAGMAAILHADLMCTDIVAAFALLLKPDRLKATLRN